MSAPAKILKTLQKSRRVLIPLHLNPDGDAVGSALALYHLLTHWGKKVEIVTADPLPTDLRFLPGTGGIKQLDPLRICLDGYDLLVLADGSYQSRFSHQKDGRLPEVMEILCIDHHPWCSAVLPHPRRIDYIHPRASATAELIFNLTKEWKVKVTPQIAQCLLTGIIADTGCFKYSSATPEVMEKATELIRLGANKDEVIFRLYQCWPQSALTLWETLLRNIKFEKGVLYTTLNRTELQKIKIGKEDLSRARSYAASEFLSAIEGVRAAAIFTDDGESVHVNLRTRTGVNVGKIAKKLGGGGHERTAGFDSAGSLEEAIDKTLRLLSRNKQQ